MDNIEFFDYKSVAEEMHVPHAILKKIEDEVREEFPSDKMLYELHILRALKSKYWQKESFAANYSSLQWIYKTNKVLHVKTNS